MTTIEINSNDWNNKVLTSKIPIIVDFWAPWCPWCMRLMPVFEEVSKQYEGRLIFAKVNVEEQQEIAQANGVLGIPIMKIFCDGRNVGELVGYMNKEKLVLELDKMLSSISSCITQSSSLQKEVTQNECCWCCTEKSQLCRNCCHSFSNTGSTFLARVGIRVQEPFKAIVSVILGVLFWLLTFYFTPTPLPDYIKMYGMSFTVTTVALGSAIAILTGINTSLIIYRKRITGSLGFKKGCGSSAGGAFTGAIASGCPVCTMPLLGIFGLGGAVALFPLQGLELKAAAIAALAISLYFTAKNVKISCKM